MFYLTLLLIIYPFSKVLFNLSVEGRENIPDQVDDLVITSTHSSYWDPPLIGITFAPQHQIHFIARQGLLKNPLFSFPVRTFSTTIDRDHFGKKDLIKMLRAFKQEGLICIFPEGTTEEAPPKSGTVRLARKTDRKFLPLKLEFERSPLEFPFFFAPARMIIGKPIDFRTLQGDSGGGEKGADDENSIDYQDLSFRLMQRIRQL